MGCACVGSNKIKINHFRPSKKVMDPCFSEIDKEYQKIQKDLEENILIIISTSHSIDSIKDTSNGEFSGFQSIISYLQS